MAKNKWENFTDEEIYMLKRQAMEGSFEIVMTGKYSESEKRIHNELLNGVIDEIKRRDSK